jgi:hypothetical protein
MWLTYAFVKQVTTNACVLVEKYRSLPKLTSKKIPALGGDFSLWLLNTLVKAVRRLPVRFPGYHRHRRGVPAG